MNRIRELVLDDEQIFNNWITEWKNEPTQVSVSNPLNTSFAEFIKQSKINSVNPVPPRVPATKFFYIADGVIKGGISCRWSLNEYLLQFGGNIGYGVAPVYRKQGIASEMVRQAIGLFKERDEKRVLITAEDWNTASQKIIRAAGGVYENTLIEADTGYKLKRYWIDL